MKVSGIGIVVIGKNEGERLLRCFDTLPRDAGRVVYVDSASTDDSVAQARQRGVEVVELDMSIPFTAARARNQGLARLLEVEPAVDLVQFVDGDCEVLPGWLPAAEQELRTHEQVAAVCGRLHERARNASVYNRLADLEWDGPTGDVFSCGGNAMMRVSAFQAAGGFNPGIAAGEEPDLCIRFRRLGYVVRRIDVDMALHDIDMKRFSQWWRRHVRSGFGTAELRALHPGPWDRDVRSAFVWGLGLPLATLAAVLISGPPGLLLLVLYPIFWARIMVRRLSAGSPLGDAALFAAGCVMAKAPQLLGMVRYYRQHGLRGVLTMPRPRTV